MKLCFTREKLVALQEIGVDPGITEPGYREMSEAEVTMMLEKIEEYSSDESTYQVAAAGPTTEYLEYLERRRLLHAVKQSVDIQKELDLTERDQRDRVRDSRDSHPKAQR